MTARLACFVAFQRLSSEGQLRPPFWNAAPMGQYLGNYEIEEKRALRRVKALNELATLYFAEHLIHNVEMLTLEMMELVMRNLRMTKLGMMKFGIARIGLPKRAPA